MARRARDLTTTEPAVERHVPERRCLGCGTRRPKEDLARFVAVPEPGGARLERDDLARRAGRGLYVCRCARCFDRAVRRRAFLRGARLSGRLDMDPALGAALDIEG